MKCSSTFYIFFFDNAAVFTSTRRIFFDDIVHYVQRTLFIVVWKARSGLPISHK